MFGHACFGGLCCKASVVSSRAAGRVSLRVANRVSLRVAGQRHVLDRLVTTLSVAPAGGRGGEKPPKVFLGFLASLPPYWVDGKCRYYEYVPLPCDP